MKNYITIVDSIINEAYANGHTTPPYEVWKDADISDKLRLYGHTDAVGRYYLNDKGMEYALRGCSEGIKKQLDMAERIQTLELEIQSFTKMKQKPNYRFGLISVILSALAFMGEFGILEGCAKLLSEIISLIVDG